MGLISEALLKESTHINLLKIPRTKRLFLVVKRIKEEKARGQNDNLCVSSIKCHNPNKIS